MSFNGMMMAGRPFISRNMVISSDSVDWNLVTEGFGGVPPVSPASVVVTVNSGINVTSMDLTGMPNGSTVRLINNGRIFGTGGAGGEGVDVDAESGA
jgi:hypothetical protein